MYHSSLNCCETPFHLLIWLTCKGLKPHGSTPWDGLWPSTQAENLGLCLCTETLLCTHPGLNEVCVWAVCRSGPSNIIRAACRWQPATSKRAMWERSSARGLLSPQGEGQVWLFLHPNEKKLCCYVNQSILSQFESNANHTFRRKAEFLSYFEGFLLLAHL